MSSHVLLRYDDLPKISLPDGRDPNEICVSDTTIREGAQMPGVVMLKKHKVRIYDYLQRIGIEKTETFLYDESDREAVKEMLDMYSTTEVTGWARANREDIDLILKFDEISETGILMSVSDSHILQKIGFESREKAKESYIDVLEYAVSHGLRPRCHLEDITRADIENFVLPFVREILDIAPNAIIRICDTLNFGIPFMDDFPYSIPRIVESLKEIGVRDVETHIHDDFGFGTAASIAALWHGANWVNATFLGMGERAGVAELEKIIVFLELRVKGFHKYNIECLTEFAEYVEREMGFRVPLNKAVVGKNVFAHESGIHAAGVLKNPFVYEPFPPEVVGAERKLVIGATSGRELIRHKIEEILRENGVEISLSKNDARVEAVFKEIKAQYERGRTSCITDEEMREFIRIYFYDIKDGDREEE